MNDARLDEAFFEMLQAVASDPEAFARGAARGGVSVEQLTAAG